MKCDDALAAMLDAELSELHPEHPAPLGLHLATCAQCRRVATQLRDDSAQLAVMVATPRVAVSRAPLRVMPWMAGAAAVAAMALVLRTPSEPASGTAPPAQQPETVAAIGVPAPVVASKSTPPAPRAGTSVRRPDVTAGNAPVRDLVGVLPDPVIAVAIESPPATLAVAFESPTAVSPAPLYATPTHVLAATTPQANPLPPPNTAVTVVPSRVPGVTALWFN